MGVKDSEAKSGFTGGNSLHEREPGQKGHYPSPFTAADDKPADTGDVGVSEGGREADIEAALEEHDRVRHGGGFVAPEGREEFVAENWPALDGQCHHEVEGGCWLCRKREAGG